MKARKHREAGGVNNAAEDLDKKNMEYTKDSNVNREAVERKRGGAAKKMVGLVHGVAGKVNAGRKPRKAGGRAGSDGNPLSSAHSGAMPAGHKTERMG